MASGLRISGVDKVLAKLDASIAKADVQAERIVRKGSAIIASNAKRQFRARPGGQRVSKRTGRIYYQGAPKFPAEPPKPTQRSGNLRNSIGLVGVRKLGAGVWESRTGPSMPYAGYVERGTSRARPFPYMAPGRDASTEAIKALAAAEWEMVAE
jgi:hypothetical protein